MPDKVIRLMIVENHAQFANALKDALGSVLGEKFKAMGIGFKFSLFPSAEEGILAIKKENDFDIVISDINLGEGLNGFKFIDFVHSFIDSQHSDKCFWILMSTDNYQGYQENAKKWGALFLPKTELSLFTKAINQYVEMKCEARVFL